MQPIGFQMASPRGKFMVTFSFDVGELQSMGLRLGNTGSYDRNNTWMTFSIRIPSGYPREQLIWLLSDEGEDVKADGRPGVVRDGKRHRQLTADITGTLYLHSRNEPELEGDPDTLSWCPKIS